MSINEDSPSLNYCIARNPTGPYYTILWCLFAVLYNTVVFWQHCRELTGDYSRGSLLFNQNAAIVQVIKEQEDYFSCLLFFNIFTMSAYIIRVDNTKQIVSVLVSCHIGMCNTG